MFRARASGGCYEKSSLSIYNSSTNKHEWHKKNGTGLCSNESLHLIHVGCSHARGRPGFGGHDAAHRSLCGPTRSHTRSQALLCRLPVCRAVYPCSLAVLRLKSECGEIKKLKPPEKKSVQIFRFSDFRHQTSDLVLVLQRYCKGTARVLQNGTNDCNMSYSYEGSAARFINATQYIPWYQIRSWYLIPWYKISVHLDKHDVTYFLPPPCIHHGPGAR